MRGSQSFVNPWPSSTSQACSRRDGLMDTIFRTRYGPMRQCLIESFQSCSSDHQSRLYLRGDQSTGKSRPGNVTIHCDMICTLSMETRQGSCAFVHLWFHFPSFLFAYLCDFRPSVGSPCAVASTKFHNFLQGPMPFMNWRGQGLEGDVPFDVRLHIGPHQRCNCACEGASKTWEIDRRMNEKVPFGRC